MGSKPPFEFLGPLVRFVLFWLGVALVIGGTTTIEKLQQPDLEACRKQGDCVQISQVALEFAWTEDAYASVKSWTEATRKRATEALRVDSWILVPGYVLVLGILCGAAARRNDQRSYRRVGVVIAWLVFVAGAVDLAENTLIGMALERPAGAVLSALAVATCIKWVLVVLALTYATLAPLSRWVLGRS
ncbi:MAG TPA: hypothetical protein VEN28_06295 [Burkholderiaceae bacterium]|jgi:hypothetical protein|nr:hypothetical protein [Burkholderiaceae bacterium]